MHLLPSAALLLTKQRFSAHRSRPAASAPLGMYYKVRSSSPAHLDTPNQPPTWYPDCRRHCGLKARSTGSEDQVRFSIYLGTETPTREKESCPTAVTHQIIPSNRLWITRCDWVTTISSVTWVQPNCKGRKINSTYQVYSSVNFK